MKFINLWKDVWVKAESIQEVEHVTVWPNVLHKVRVYCVDHVGNKTIKLKTYNAKQGVDEPMAKAQKCLGLILAQLENAG